MYRNRAQRTARGGFTIIELLIVVIVIGVLAAAGIGKYQGFAETARVKTCLGNQHTIENAIGTWCTQNTPLSEQTDGAVRFNTRGLTANVGGGTAAPFIGGGGANLVIANVIRDPKAFVCPKLLQTFQNISANIPLIPPAGNNGATPTRTGVACNVGCYLFYYNGPNAPAVVGGLFANGVTGSWNDPAGNTVAHQIAWCGGYGGFNCDTTVVTLQRYLHSDRWAQF